MKHSVALTIVSLPLDPLSDISSGGRQHSQDGLGKSVESYWAPILVVWLYGTLVLSERRSGYVIMLLGLLLGSGIPVIRMMGKGVGVAGNIAKSSGATLIALGVTALFSVALSARGSMGPGR